MSVSMSMRSSTEIGALLKQLRKSAGLSQMKVADKIGVSYQQIQKYENGKSNLTIPRLVQFSDVFGVHPCSIISKGGASVAEQKSGFKGFSTDEAKLLMLYRKVGKKKLKDGLIEALEDIVNITKKR